MMDKKPPDYWYGNRGLAIFVCLAMVCAAFNWMAWIGGPTRDLDGSPALCRGMGHRAPTTRGLYLVARAMEVFLILAWIATACTFLYSVIVPSKSHSGRNYAKAALVLLAASVVSTFIGSALADVFP